MTLEQIMQAVKDGCDGTYNDDPAQWTWAESQAETLKRLNDLFRSSHTQES